MQGLRANAMSSVVNQQPKEKRPAAGANGPFEMGKRVRYRLRPLAGSSRTSEFVFMSSIYHSSFMQSTLVGLVRRG